ncbi:hypothetical protein QOZ80_5AG0393060 [Eleusine coracana subsp. coracana]|nr:hypothetical protein QOZ80_5AG0393060 [Eleusine coracana subsp. coracana]
MANQGIDPLNPLQEIDPFSTTDDEKLIALLKSLCDPSANSGAYNKEMRRRFPRFVALGGHRSSQRWREPSDLPPCFIMRSKKSLTSCRQTRQGYWKEKEFRSIRRVHQRHSGVKRTLEFHQHDDTKTDWLMEEYFLLDPYKTSHDLHLNEEMVLCMVFQKNKDRVPLPLRNLDRSLNGDDDDEESCCALSPQREVELNRMITSFGECLQPGDGFGENNELATGDHQMRSTKRARSIAPHGKSDVWQHFTKIHTDDSDVLYAACHHCDMVLKAHSKNGTSTLRRHSTKCSCNLQKQT